MDFVDFWWQFRCSDFHALCHLKVRGDLEISTKLRQFTIVHSNGDCYLRFWLIFTEIGTTFTGIQLVLVESRTEPE